MKRELIEIPLGQHVAVGTAHLPDSPGRRTAIVLLNAGHVPRNGHGALAAILADHLCRSGWPVLRVDLPGLGDAPGRLPERIETFWLELKSGGHAEWASRISRWAARRFAVDHICIGGVCGAAITSIFTADRFPDSVDSLLLIEPELFTSDPPSGADQLFPGASGAAEAKGAAEAAGVPGGISIEATESPEGLLHSIRRFTSSWTWMRILAKRRSGLRWLNLAQKLLLTASSGSGVLPERANMPLVEAFSRVSRRGVPMLVLSAEGLLWEAYFLRLRSKMLGHARSRALHISVPGANHVFSNSAARETVLRSAPAWLEQIDGSLWSRQTRRVETARQAPR